VSAPNETPGGNGGGTYVQKIREDTTRAISEVKVQNERLRGMVAGLESDRARLQGEKLRLQEQLMNVREDLAQRVEEHSALLRRLSDVQRENESVSGRFVEIETLNTNLANLYVALHQLHGGIDRQQVLAAIREIVINLIGSEDFAIFERDGEQRLRMIDWFEEPPALFHEVPFGEGIIGQVVSTGYPALMANVGSASSTASLQENVTSYHARSGQLASLLILPLRTRREMLGAIVIAANDPDRAMTDEKLPLAEVLAERAALAIENAKLYTEQVEARRKVEDLSRLKDEFLSIASHELRTPVTSIKGYTQLAKMLIKEGDLNTSEEYLDIALDQIDRMSRLILELLDVSRIETGRLEIRREPIAWAHFVRDVVHRHHTAVSDRRFHVSVTDDAKIVTGDRDRLEQVLGNLLENAVKYSPDGSDITVAVEDRGDSFVTAVCDRGIGIPADELGQVFERFHRGRQVSSTNYGGLGLGLYITKQIIERHGGSIWVESKEGQGTTFYFSLPVSSDEPAGTASQSPTQAVIQA